MFWSEYLTFNEYSPEEETSLKTTAGKVTDCLGSEAIALGFRQYHCLLNAFIPAKADGPSLPF